MNNKIISGEIHLLDKNNKKVNLQGTYIYQPNSADFTAGNDLKDTGNIHVNVAGWVQIKPPRNSDFIEIYLAQGTHPIVVKAIKATTETTSALVYTDILIVI